jgi:nitrous oxidase accessory protein NosD
MARRLPLLSGVLLALGVVVPAVGIAGAADAGASTACTFTKSGSTMLLTGSCSTSKTILVTSGETLDGQNFHITATDPAKAAFDGPVVGSEGATDAVRIENLTIVGKLTRANTGCKDTLSGITIDDVTSSTIKDVTIKGIDRGAADDCADGDGIDIYASDSETQTVTIEHSSVTNFQSSGINIEGHALARIENNTVSAYEASQSPFSCYAITTGDDAQATISDNHVTDDCSSPSTPCNGIALYNGGSTNSITGNTVDGTCDSNEWQTNAILLWETSDVVVKDNTTSFSGDTLGPSTGISVWDQGFSADADGNTISGNVVDGSPLGITVISHYESNTTMDPDASTNTVDHNQVDDPADGTDGIVVSQCSGQPLACQSEGNSVEHNTITCYAHALVNNGTGTIRSGNVIDSCPAPAPSDAGRRAPREPDRSRPSDI